MQAMLQSFGADVRLEKVRDNLWSIEFTNRQGKRAYGHFSQANWAVMFAYAQVFGPDGMQKEKEPYSI